MPGINFAELRRRVRIGQVLTLVDFHASQQRGEQLRGSCPLHGAHSPRSRSFAVHLGKGVYHCFVCAAHGNAVELWAACTRQRLYPAALDLCQRLAVEVPWLPAPVDSPRKRTTNTK
jgi:DNA primase